MKKQCQTMRAILAVVLSAALTAPAQADYTVQPDPSDSRGVWEGFGAGLSWWANAVGNSPYESTYTNLFFGTASVQFMGASVPGLGLNLVRYNIGGGGLASDSPSGVKDQRPTIQPWYKDMDGFWRDWFSTDPESASYDWTRDARQRAVLSSLRERGVTVEFVSHAPMWWMMDSRSSAGGQLQTWNRRDHARYLATVVQQARTRWGVQVQSITPFNEPTAGWWNYPVEQEGANIPIDAQAEILGYLREELDMRGLTDVTIAASDENTVKQALATYQALSRRYVTVRGQSVSAASLVGKVNVHGYDGLQPWRDDQARRDLRRGVGDKRLWVSEYGDTERSGLLLAQSILADINQLRATAWLYWQPLEPFSAWGLVNGQYGDPADEGAPHRGQPLWLYKKYPVFAQFTRFLRPGYQLIGSSDGSSVVAHDAAGRKLVLITMNEGAAQSILYDLSRFYSITGTTASVTTTTFDGVQRLAPSTVQLNGKQLRLQVPAGSVQTVEINGVDLGPQAKDIRSASSGLCVDVAKSSAAAGSSLVQTACAGLASQRWWAVQNGTDLNLRASHTGMCMNVNSFSMKAGGELIQWPCSGTSNELFEARPQGLGYALVARHSGLCVDLKNSSAAPDTPLTQQTCTGSPSQTWYLALGTGTLQSTGNYLCVDIPGGSTQAGTPATQWECIGSTNQQWKLTADREAVQISSMKSGQCLTVAQSSQSPGAPVVQWACNGAAEQRFQRKPQGHGFALVASHSGMCLSTEYGSQAWGRRIVQQPCNGSANQTWR